MLRFRFSTVEAPGGMIGLRVHFLRDGRTVTQVECGTVPASTLARKQASIRRALFAARVLEDAAA